MIKKKLLLVADTYYPKVDGTLKFVEEFVRRSRDDFEISLLVPNLSKGKRWPLEEKVRRVTFIEPSTIISLSGYPNMKLTRINKNNIINAVEEADLVFIQGPGLISYLSIYYSHKLKRKTFFYVHTISWELFAKFFPSFLGSLFLMVIRRFSVMLYNRCNQMMVPYHGLKESLLNHGVKTKIDVAKLGVDIDVFSPAKDKHISKEKVGLDPQKIVIGYVGRISKEKNTAILLEAFEKLKHQEQIHLLIVGDGTSEQKKKLKEKPNCTITGFVNNVQDYLKAMDIFVMPSLTETTSLATLEAMSCGLPVIASRVGYIKDYITRNYNGLFFPKNNAALLALKLENLIQDTALRFSLGENARKTIVYSFSWDRSINQIKKILKDEIGEDK